MVDELRLPPFGEWWPGAWVHWVAVAGGLAIAALAFGLLLAVLRHGPAAGLRLTGKVLRDALVDLLRVSPRRVSALTWLAVKESVRRRIVVGFAVFLLVLLFAGWFLDPNNINPARLYISFVLTATSYLVLLLALFLSAFSLPTDLRTRTLHTVVTKPVRLSEIVLGRIFGFTLIGTGLLALMCLISYTFVVRGLAHTHELRPEDVRRAEAGRAKLADRQTSSTLRVYTTRVHGHQHAVTIDLAATQEPRQVASEVEQGHWHDLTYRWSSPRGSASARLHAALGGPQGALVARVPHYGKLRFRDRDGLDAAEGINVGDEWAYRSYVQGGSQAAAIWTFEGITPESFPDGLPVEMVLGVFRTHKGNIEKGVLGSLSVRNPRTGLTVEVEIFESKEFTINQLIVPREIRRYSSKQVILRRIPTPQGMRFEPSRESADLRAADKTRFDLFDDLVADGKTEIWLRCLEPAQYFGAAERDLYLRAADASFELNFVKGYFGIWTQMVLVIGFGVMFSTFLSGPVAMIGTLGIVVAGLFSSFVIQLAYGKTYGGGPVESAIRLFTQQNMITELDPGLSTTVAKMTDVVLLYSLRVVGAVLPAFADLSYANWVADGFNVPADMVMIHTLTVLGFLVPLVVAGYLFLKTREVER